MFEFVQLEQLLAIDKYKTLSKAAEELLISQPALSRSMQRLEEELQVTLFTRQKNKITFNENGKLALEYARKIVNSSLEMKEHLQAFDKSNHTISIGSCAPAPIWNLAPEVSRLFPDMKIQSDMNSLDELVDGLINNKYHIIITNDEMNCPNIISRKYCEEHLYISLPPAHPLAGHKSLTLNDLNGQSILILSKIGFWYDICKAKMPDSLFLVQEELSALDELRKSSALPAFATDLSNKSSSHDHRILIPLTDPEVNVTFYINYNKSYKRQFESIIYTK